MKKQVHERRDALGKMLELLRLILSENGDKQWGTRELAEKLHLLPATVHRSLLGLAKQGLVQQDCSSKKYQLGGEFLRLALRVQGDFALRNVGIPVMQNLVKQCNETALLGFYDRCRREMMFVAVVNSSNPLRYVVPINEWMPIYLGAGGLAIMAFLPEEERQSIIQQTGLAAVTEQTITDPHSLEVELARVRQRGYAFSCGQRTRGAMGIGAPIWGSNARVLGALNISLPESRFQRNMRLPLATLVMKHADEITTELGGRAPNKRKRNEERT